MLLSNVAMAATPMESTTEKPATAAADSAESRVIAAMKAEVQRSYEALKKADPPVYFIAYRLYDQEIAEVSADHGSLMTVTPYQRDRTASVEVRVGNYDLDSTHRLVNEERQEAENTLGAFGVVPFDDDKAIRNTLWLETEKEYRIAAQRYGRVLAQQGLKSEEDVCADLSVEKPNVRIEKGSWDDKPDLEPFKKAAQSLSAIFDQYPDIEQSWTHFKIERTVRYVVNTEGTAVADRAVRVAYSTGATSTATDGERISRNEVFYFSKPEDLAKLQPKFEQLARAVASSVGVLRKSPLADPYCGPVMMRGQAAAVLFHEVLGHRLEASRHKDSHDGKTFSKMLNQNILPPFISVYDKPSVEEIGGVELNGHYFVDDDGVPAQDVTLIKDGKLISFLMGRSPIPSCNKSNGHGRTGSTTHYDPVSRMANLIVESKKQTSEDTLRQHLLDEIKRQGKPYGLIIEQVRGGETNTSSYQAQMFQIRPSLVRRVWADGRPDDYIRGVRVIGTPMAALQRIVETSDKTEVMNGFCGAESGWVAQANCAPALLLDSLEIERETPDKGIARILPPPPALTPQTAVKDKEKSLKEPAIDAATK
jgi:predicted Zn-dependent protease